MQHSTLQIPCCILYKQGYASHCHHAGQIPTVIKQGLAVLADLLQRNMLRLYHGTIEDAHFGLFVSCPIENPTNLRVCV